MSRESGPVRPLEQRKSGPGEYVIEGYKVYRTQDAMDSRNWWWTAEGSGQRHHTHYFSDIKDWIRDQVSRPCPVIPAPPSISSFLGSYR